jgi:tetratricopeptide (TPR) repeat protein
MKHEMFSSLRMYVSQLVHLPADRLNRAAIAAGQRGDLDHAEILLRRAIAMAPRLGLPRINLCNALIPTGRLREAREQLEEALRAPLDRRTRQDAHYQLATVLGHSGDFERAIEEYRRADAMVRRPAADIHLAIGGCYEQLGDWTAAEREMLGALSAATAARDAAVSSQCQNRLARFRDRARRAALVEHRIVPLALPAAPALSRVPPGARTGEDLAGVVDAGTRTIWFVGAGISHPLPSGLPLAAHVVEALFATLFAVDREVVAQVLGLPLEVSPEDAYTAFQRALGPRVAMGFEAFFSALTPTVGTAAIGFARLLLGIPPNDNHRWLATALARGDMVITVNFDECIESAFRGLFPGLRLKVVVHPHEFAADLRDQHVVEGKLVKLHGTASDLASVALTIGALIQDPWVDTTAGRVTRIEPGAWVRASSSTLDPAKRAFLVEVLRSLIVIAGYSGSDVFDLMPLLSSATAGWHGLWIDHRDSSRSTDGFSLLEETPRRHRVIGDTSQVFQWWAAQRGTVWPADANPGASAPPFAQRLSEWLRGLRIEAGDGVVCMARLCSAAGALPLAAKFYAAGSQRYGESGARRKQIASAINQLAVTVGGAAPGHDHSAAYAALAARTRAALDDETRSLHATLLANWAGHDLSRPQGGDLTEIESRLREAREHAMGARDLDMLAFVVELMADLELRRGDPRAAIPRFEEAVRINRASGGVEGLVDSLCSLARTLCHLGRVAQAHELLREAHDLATRSGNLRFMDRVRLVAEQCDWHE